MFFHVLYLRLRQLIATRNVAGLHDQLLQQGPARFANTLATTSPRVVADALSLLSFSDRLVVLRHLPAPLRETMRPLCIGGSQRLHARPMLPRAHRPQTATTMRRQRP